MIRLSEPEDTPEIERLALAQFRRTPWPLDMAFPPVMAILVNQRFGHISACLGYRWDGDMVRPMHVWAEDGFAGRRGAVELMRCLGASADADGLELVFTARAWNQGLRSAVEQHGCEPSVGEDAETVVYRRKARRWEEA